MKVITCSELVTASCPDESGFINRLGFRIYRISFAEHSKAVASVD